MSELPSWCRVGQRVVCVNGWAWYDEARGPLSRYCVGPCIEHGDVYTISVLCPHGPSFKLVETDPSLGWWQANRFRPVRDTSIESLRALLNPTPDEIERLREDVLS